MVVRQYRDVTDDEMIMTFVGKEGRSVAGANRFATRVGAAVGMTESARVWGGVPHCAGERRHLPVALFNENVPGIIWGSLTMRVSAVNSLMRFSMRMSRVSFLSRLFDLAEWRLPPQAFIEEGVPVSVWGIWGGGVMVWEGGMPRGVQSAYLIPNKAAAVHQVSAVALDDKLASPPPTGYAAMIKDAKTCKLFTLISTLTE